MGYGPNPPVKPHHRGASCPDAPAVSGRLLPLKFLALISNALSPTHTATPLCITTLLLCTLPAADTPINRHCKCYRTQTCKLQTKTQTCDYNWVNNPGANPRTIVGALVGGPDPSDIYRDDRTDVRNNEVCASVSLLHTQICL